jgi:phytoene dehydrogenase-like protein
MNVMNGRVASVELDDGEVLTADAVLSSAGSVETMKLCSQSAPKEPLPGQLSFMESISVLDRLPESYGHNSTITFFNNSERFDYRSPEELADPRSGVICCPNNFCYDKPLEEGIVRVTSLANFRGWTTLSEEEYVRAKKEWYERCVAEAVKFIPDFRKHVVYIDTFTPRTIKKFTGHLNGAVYGAPEKLKDGRTHLSNLFICGTDQGFLGIIGAILSGISMANLHVLQGSKEK